MSGSTSNNPTVGPSKLSLPPSQHYTLARRKRNKGKGKTTDTVVVTSDNPPEYSIDDAPTTAASPSREPTTNDQRATTSTRGKSGKIPRSKGKTWRSKGTESSGGGAYATKRTLSFELYTYFDHGHPRVSASRSGPLDDLETATFKDAVNAVAASLGNKDYLTNLSQTKAAYSTATDIESCKTAFQNATDKLVGKSMTDFSNASDSFNINCRVQPVSTKELRQYKDAGRIDAARTATLQESLNAGLKSIENPTASGTQKPHKQMKFGRVR